MPIVYGKISDKSVDTPPVIVQQETKSRFPWWANLLISIGVGLISWGIGSLVSTTVSVAAGIATRAALEIGGQVLTDVLTGYSDPLTLALDIGLPLLSAASQISRVSRARYSPLYQISKNIDDVAEARQLSKLAQDLQYIEKASFSTSSQAVRNYDKVLSQYAKIGAKEVLPESIKRTGDEAVNRAVIYTKRIKTIDKAIRKVNRTISLLDPNYAIKRYVNQSTKPIKKFLNKRISKYTRYLSQTSRRIKKAVAKAIIPLNHTQAPWIEGIKLIDSFNTVGRFNVVIYFNPALTNNNPPVFLYNKSFNDFVKPFLEASSAGRHYIDNIAWGWEVGAFLKKYSFLKGFGYVPYLQTFASTAMSLKRTALLVRAMIKDGGPLSQYKKKNINLVSSAIEGLLTGIKIPQINLIKNLTKTIQTRDSRYLITYGAQTLSRSIKKRSKSRNKKYIYNTYIRR